jgi:hypothetical protein
MRKLLTFSLLSAACAYAQVVFNNANTMSHASGTSLTATVTVAAGHSNLAAFACVARDGANGSTVTSITLGGQSMTSAGTAAGPRGGAAEYAQLFYLVNPPTGSNTLAITTSAGLDIQADLVSFYGVSQTTPVRPGTYRTTGGDAANGATLAIASSTSPGDLTMSCLCAYSMANNGTNQTQDGYNGIGNATSASDHATVAGSTVTHSWSNNYGDWVMAGLSIMAQPVPPVLSFDSGCPASGFLRTTSASCTVNLFGATFDGTHSVTISDGGELGTLTSGGSSAQNSITVTPGSGTSFSFTYNPYLVGNKGLTLTNGNGWTNAALSYMVSRNNDACTFTAKAGTDVTPALWTSASTWTASGAGCVRTTPDTGDTIIIGQAGVAGYHVKIPAGTTAYLGTCPANNTIYDFTITPSAYNGTSSTLEVAGTLWLCGNGKLNSPSASSPAAFAKFQLDTGGAFIYDNNNSASVAYRIIPGATGGWNNLIVGTLGDTCTFGATYSCPTNITGINLASLNPLLISTNATTDNMTYQVYGAAIKNCGSATVGCLEYETNNASTSYANAGLIDIEGSVFDTTGTIQDPIGLAPITSITAKNNRFMNDLAGIFSTSANPGNSIGGKTCLFQGNVASGQAGWSTGMHGEAWDGCSFVGNVWEQGFVLSALNYMPMAAFSWNLQFVGANGSPSDQALSPPVVLNDYWIGNTSASWHMATGTLDMSQTMDGGIFENVNASNNEGHLADDNYSDGSITRTMRNTISLLGPGGYTAGTGLMSAMISTPAPMAIQEHDGWFGSAHSGWGGWLDHPSGSDGMFPSNQEYLYYRSNSHWATSGSTNFALGDGQGNPSESPGSNYNVAGIGNNNIYGGSTAATYGPGVNSHCNAGGNGSSSFHTHYDICTPSGTPGANDLAVDPKTLDITRNAAAWAYRKHGQTACNGAIGASVAPCVTAAMMACPDAWYCVEELWSWVRQGMQPTNLALKGKAHDGKVVGVSGTFGSGYTGSCGVTFTAQDSGDLGTGATATCTFAGGVPSVTITNGGNYYRVATPAAVRIACGGCTPAVPASLNAVVAPSDIGPVQIIAFGRVE